MLNFSRTCLALLFLTFASVGVMHAKTAPNGMPCGKGTGHSCGNYDNDTYHPDSPVSTPEINPSMAAGAFALMSGGIMVLRGRRKA